MARFTFTFLAAWESNRGRSNVSWDVPVAGQTGRETYTAGAIPRVFTGQTATTLYIHEATLTVDGDMHLAISPQFPAAAATLAQLTSRPLYAAFEITDGTLTMGSYSPAALVARTSGGDTLSAEHPHRGSAETCYWFVRRRSRRDCSFKVTLFDDGPPRALFPEPGIHTEMRHGTDEVLGAAWGNRRAYSGAFGAREFDT